MSRPPDKPPAVDREPIVPAPRDSIPADPAILEDPAVPVDPAVPADPVAETDGADVTDGAEVTGSAAGAVGGSLEGGPAGDGAAGSDGGAGGRVGSSVGGNRACAPLGGVSHTAAAAVNLAPPRPRRSPRPSPASEMPLVRGRERCQLLRRTSIFSGMSELQLSRLAAAAVEKSATRYQALRPTHSLYVLVYGAVESVNEADDPRHVLPPELLHTAPDPLTAAAAAAVAADAAFAGKASEAGATVGIDSLVGPLQPTAPSLRAAEPTLLLALAAADVAAALPARSLEALRAEARLRLLVDLPFFVQNSAPVRPLRDIASSSRLHRWPPGRLLFSAGEPAELLFLLLHGRVDLLDSNGTVVRTVPAPTSRGGAPPLVGLLPEPEPEGGETDPRREAPPQTWTAVCADHCLLLTGGLAAAEALRPLLPKLVPEGVKAGGGGSPVGRQQSVAAGAGRTARALSRERNAGGCGGLPDLGPRSHTRCVALALRAARAGYVAPRRTTRAMVGAPSG